ncbi:MAG: phosphonate degradation HD-domain oxygenase [Alphaproteobacteria bacterium]
MSPAREIGAIMAGKGANRYGDEAISQLDHALQCAALAENSGASPAMIAACLLHDIGHMVDNRFEGAARQGVDRRHEKIGAAFLRQWFGPGVTEPVILHVPAKRYICAVDSDYADTLSPASVRSLELQGGPFDCDDARRFIRQAYAQDAVQLRRWDDEAKTPEAATPPLDHFLCYVEVALKSSHRDNP